MKKIKSESKKQKKTGLPKPRVSIKQRANSQIQKKSKKSHIIKPFLKTPRLSQTSTFLNDSRFTTTKNSFRIAKKLDKAIEHELLKFNKKLSSTKENPMLRTFSTRNKRSFSPNISRNHRSPISARTPFLQTKTKLASTKGRLSSYINKAFNGKEKKNLKKVKFEQKKKSKEFLNTTSNFFKSRSKIHSHENLKYQESVKKVIKRVRSVFREENWNFKNLIGINPNLGFAISDLWFLDLQNSKMFMKTEFVDLLKIYMKKNFITDNVSFINIRDISVNNYLSFQEKIQGFINQVQSKQFNLPNQKDIEKYPFIFKNILELINKRKNCIKLNDEHYSKMLHTLQKLCPSFMSSSQYTPVELDNIVQFLDLAFEDTTNFEVNDGRVYAEFELVEKKILNLNNLNALHSIIFCDIVRQVSLDSAKRGYVLAKIWNFSMSVLKTTVESLSNAMAYVSKLYVDERNMVDELYSKLNNKKIDKINLLEKEITELKSKLINTERKLDASLSTEKKLRTKLLRYKVAFKSMKKELKRNKWERRKVAIRLIGARAQIEKYKTQKRFVNPFALVKKPSTSMIFTKEFQNIDQVIEEQYKEIREQEGELASSHGVTDSSISSNDNSNSQITDNDELEEMLNSMFVGVVGNNGEIERGQRDRGTNYDQEAYNRWHVNESCQTEITLVKGKFDFIFKDNQLLNELADNQGLFLSPASLKPNEVNSEVYKSKNILKKNEDGKVGLNESAVTVMDDEMHQAILKYVGLEGNDTKFSKNELYALLYGSSKGPLGELNQFIKDKITGNSGSIDRTSSFAMKKNSLENDMKKEEKISSFGELSNNKDKKIIEERKPSLKENFTHVEEQIGENIFGESLNKRKIPLKSHESKHMTFEMIDSPQVVFGEEKSFFNTKIQVRKDMTDSGVTVNFNDPTKEKTFKEILDDKEEVDSISEIPNIMINGVQKKKESDHHKNQLKSMMSFGLKNVKKEKNPPFESPNFNINMKMCSIDRNSIHSSSVKISQKFKKNIIKENSSESDDISILSETHVSNKFSSAETFHKKKIEVKKIETLPEVVKNKLMQLKKALNLAPEETKKIISKSIKKKRTKTNKFKQATKMITMLNNVKKVNVKKNELEEKLTVFKKENFNLKLELRNLKKHMEKMKTSFDSSISPLVKRKRKASKRRGLMDISIDSLGSRSSCSMISKASRPSPYRRKNTTMSKSPIKRKKNRYKMRNNLSTFKKHKTTRRKSNRVLAVLRNDSQTDFRSKIETGQKMTYNICYSMIKKARAKKVNRKKTRVYSQKYVLRTITTVYRELKNFDESSLMELEFPIYVHNHFIKEYGKHKKTKKKFYKFLLSLKTYNLSIRISIFCKFMHLYDFSNYSSSDLKVYITGLKTLERFSSIGFEIPFNETDSRHMTVFNRALEYFKFLFDSKGSLTPKAIKSRKEKLMRLKEKDPTGRNRRGGVIDVDQFLSYVIDHYRTMIEKTQTYVKYAFAAADLDGSQKVTLKEFFLLFKYLEPDYYNEVGLIALFKQTADTEEDGELAMTLNKFSEMCFSKGYFKLSHQYRFIGIEGGKKSDDVLFKKIEDLSKKWEVKKDEFNRFIEQNDDINRVFWSKAVCFIDEELEKGEQETYLQVLISYNILEKQFKEFQIKQELNTTLQNSRESPLHHGHGLIKALNRQRIGSLNRKKEKGFTHTLKVLGVLNEEKKPSRTSLGITDD